MSIQTSVSLGNNNHSVIAHANLESHLNNIENTQHIVLANYNNGPITLSDFITTFRNFSQSLSATTQDMIDPINLAGCVTKLIDEKCPGASVIDKLNVLVRCGSTIKIERGPDFWLGHLIDFCVGMSLLNRMEGDITKNEGFPTIQGMWANFVNSLPGPE